MSGVGLLLCASVLVGCGGGGSSTAAVEPSPSVEPSVVVPPLQLAKEECAPVVQDFQLGDEGSTLTLDMPGEDETGATMERLVCVLNATEIPDAIVSRMDRTRALDGMQDATWGEYAASWTYHPDDGLDVVLTHEASE